MPKGKNQGHAKRSCLASRANINNVVRVLWSFIVRLQDPKKNGHEWTIYQDSPSTSFNLLQQPSATLSLFKPP